MKQVAGTMYPGKTTKMPARPLLCGTMKYAQHPSLRSGLRPRDRMQQQCPEPTSTTTAQGTSNSQCPQTPPAQQQEQHFEPAAAASKDHGDGIGRVFFNHSSAKRVNTDAVITQAITKQHPNLDLVVVSSGEYPCDLLAFAAAGKATATPLKDPDSDAPSLLKWTEYFPPARRMGNNKGALGEMIVYGKFLYNWDGEEFVAYLIDGRDGTMGYPIIRNWYILTADKRKADELVLAVGAWESGLHNEVWVFDQGMFFKDRELWESAQKSEWADVILDDDMKKSLIDDHLSFFESRDTYKNLGVPWKRGLIYHGPPGNGKTISIKATMHMLADRKPTIPTIYVRTLESWMGPEFSIHMIFEKAREFAPCYLVLEDIDTLIDPSTRSYFLNEVDGLKQNDGIFIIASTNHLDRLDPGISKRPSRFDRKYYFPDPNVDQREAYCRYWQAKLKDNDDIEFPDKLCRAIAEITDKFSFAYIQEAFVATLLAIARRSKTKRTSGGSSEAWVLVSDDEDDEESGRSLGGGDRDDDLDKVVLWVEMKRQVKILREGMEEEKEY